MLAELLTTEVMVDGVPSSRCEPDPEWPTILQAFHELDGRDCSWMTLVSGERQISIGGGERGYVVTAEANCQILQGVPLASDDTRLELWVNGLRRPCRSQQLLPANQALEILKAFALAGTLSAQIHWEAA